MKCNERTRTIMGMPNHTTILNGLRHDPRIKIIDIIEEPAQGRAQAGDYVTIVYEIVEGDVYEI